MPSLHCSVATVRVFQQLRVLVLDRDTFVRVLGPLQAIMEREKSPEVGVQHEMSEWEPDVMRMDSSCIL